MYDIKQSSPHFSANCNTTLLNRNNFQFTPRNVKYWDFTKWMRGCDWLKIPKFSPRNIKRLRWENLGIFSQLKLCIYLVKSQYNTLRGVHRKKCDWAKFYCSWRRNEVMTEEKYLSLMTVWYLPIKYIQIDILSSRHLQRNRYIDKIR
jgi:hypothetical protein